MTIKQKVELGDIKVEIDNWGGCHFHLPEDMHNEDILSLDPDFMDDVEKARREVIENES